MIDSTVLLFLYFLYLQQVAATYSAVKMACLLAAACWFFITHETSDQ